MLTLGLQILVYLNNGNLAVDCCTRYLEGLNSRKNETNAE